MAAGSRRQGPNSVRVLATLHIGEGCRFVDQVVAGGSLFSFRTRNLCILFPEK